MGYQACELKGTAYIGFDKTYGEKLTNLNNEDEAVFRYVESSYPLDEIIFTASGSGMVEIVMNGKTVGAIEIKDGIQLNSNINMAVGTQEMVFKFKDVDDLEIMEVVLN